MRAHVAAVFTVAALLAAGCGGGDGANPGATTSTARTPEATTSPAASTAATSTTLVPTTAVACPAVTTGGSSSLGILGGAVAVFDTATGAFAWEVAAGIRTTVAGIGDLVVVGDETAVRAYDAANGSLRWCRTPGGVVVIAGEAIVVLSTTSLAGLDPATSRELWSTPVQVAADAVPLLGLPPTALHGGRVNAYLDTSPLAAADLSTLSGRAILAVDPASGATRWSWTPSSPSGASLTEGSLAYVTDANTGRALALDSLTGAERWSISTGGAAGSVAVTDSTVAFAVATLPTPAPPDSTGQVLAVDAASGERRWAAPAEVEFPGPVATGDLVAALSWAVTPTETASGSGRVDALDAASGELRWKHDLPAGTPLAITPVGAVLVVSVEPVGLVALDQATGAEQWRAQHTSTLQPAGTDSTTGYLDAVPVAGGTRFAALTNFLDLPS